MSGCTPTGAASSRCPGVSADSSNSRSRCGPDLRGRGHGRALLRDALALAPPGEPVFAAVAPGNAASLRALLAAAFVPIGSVQLVRPGPGRC